MFVTIAGIAPLLDAGPSFGDSNSSARASAGPSIYSVLTDSQTAERARDFVTGTLGRTAITAPDRSGFVVNALLVPYLLAAIRMLDSGHATADDIVLTAGDGAAWA